MEPSVFSTLHHGTGFDSRRYLQPYYDAEHAEPSSPLPFAIDDLGELNHPTAPESLDPFYDPFSSLDDPHWLDYLGELQNLGLLKDMDFTESHGDNPTASEGQKKYEESVSAPSPAPGMSSPPPRTSSPVRRPGSPDGPIRCYEHGCGGRTFSSKGNYQRHLKEQSGSAAKFICPTCGRSFSRSTARNSHVKEQRCANTSQRVPLHQAPFIIPARGNVDAPTIVLQSPEAGTPVGTPFGEPSSSASSSLPSSIHQPHHQPHLPSDSRTVLGDLTVDIGPHHPIGENLFPMDPSLASSEAFSVSPSSPWTPVGFPEPGLNPPHGALDRRRSMQMDFYRSGYEMDRLSPAVPTLSSSLGTTVSTSSSLSQPRTHSQQQPPQPQQTLPPPPLNFNTVPTNAPEPPRPEPATEFHGGSDENESGGNVLISCYDHGCNGRTFSTYGNYRRHLKERSGRTAFLCRRCGRSFSRSTARNTHEQKNSCGAGGSGSNV